MISNTAQTMQFYPFSSEYINANVTGTGVYMIRNILNQKCYVGSSTNLRRILQTHICHLKKQRHANKHLQAAFNKYGQKAFEFAILEHCEPIVDTLTVIEQKYLDLKPEYNNAPKAYTNIGCRHTEEFKKRISQIRTGKPKPLVNSHEYKEARPLKQPNRLKKNRFVPVIQMNLDGEFIAEYESISSAARAINRAREGIRDVCRGKQISAFGFKWKYKNSQL